MGEAADVLDLRGVKCPLPALLTRRHLAAAPPGTVITVLADDPMAAIDVPHMCRNEGFETVTVERDGDQSRMTLRKP
jgi:tRNA 2-thiouridine synthesizing protein A